MNVPDGGHPEELEHAVGAPELEEDGEGVEVDGDEEVGERGEREGHAEALEDDGVLGPVVLEEEEAEVDALEKVGDGGEGGDARQAGDGPEVDAEVRDGLGDGAGEEEGQQHEGAEARGAGLEHAHGEGEDGVEHEERADRPPGRVDVVDEGGGDKPREAAQQHHQQAQGLRLALGDQEEAWSLYCLVVGSFVGGGDDKWVSARERTGLGGKCTMYHSIKVRRSTTTHAPATTVTR